MRLAAVAHMHLPMHEGQNPASTNAERRAAADAACSEVSAGRERNVHEATAARRIPQHLADIHRLWQPPMGIDIPDSHGSIDN